MENVRPIPKSGEEHTVIEFGAAVKTCHRLPCPPGFRILVLVTGPPSSLPTVNQPQVNLMSSPFPLLCTEMGL